jgi:hypothetical protein
MRTIINSTVIEEVDGTARGAESFLATELFVGSSALPDELMIRKSTMNTIDKRILMGIISFN